jgi:hypothetical protein
MYLARLCADALGEERGAELDEVGGDAEFTGSDLARVANARIDLCFLRFDVAVPRDSPGLVPPSQPLGSLGRSSPRLARKRTDIAIEFTCDGQVERKVLNIPRCDRRGGLQFS